MQRPDLMPDHVLAATIATLRDTQERDGLIPKDERRLSDLLYEQRRREQVRADDRP